MNFELFQEEACMISWFYRTELFIKTALEFIRRNYPYSNSYNLTLQLENAIVKLNAIQFSFRKVLLKYHGLDKTIIRKFYKQADLELAIYLGASWSSIEEEEYLFHNLNRLILRLSVVDLPNLNSTVTYFEETYPGSALTSQLQNIFQILDQDFLKINFIDFIESHGVVFDDSIYLNQEKSVDI